MFEYTYDKIGQDMQLNFRDMLRYVVIEEIGLDI